MTTQRQQKSKKKTTKKGTDKDTTADAGDNVPDNAIPDVFPCPWCDYVSSSQTSTKAHCMRMHMQGKSPPGSTPPKTTGSFEDQELEELKQEREKMRVLADIDKFERQSSTSHPEVRLLKEKLERMERKESQEKMLQPLREEIGSLRSEIRRLGNPGVRQTQLDTGGMRESVLVRELEALRQEVQARREQGIYQRINELEGKIDGSGRSPSMAELDAKRDLRLISIGESAVKEIAALRRDARETWQPLGGELLKRMLKPSPEGKQRSQRYSPDRHDEVISRLAQGPGKAEEVLPVEIKEVVDQ